MIHSQGMFQVKDSFEGPWTVNLHFVLPHTPAWHDDFSPIPKFPCHDSFDSKGLNFGQNVGAGGSML